MGAAATLVSEILGVEQVPMKYANEGRKHNAQIGPGIHVEVEDFVGGLQEKPTQLVGVAHPAASTLTIARATHSHIKAFGIDYDGTGKSGFSAPFSWQG